MTKYYLLIFFLLFLSITLSAQFQISAEVRPRAEIRDGYKQLSDTLEGPAFFVSQRSRLALGFSKENKYQACLAVQDVRVFVRRERAEIAFPGVGWLMSWLIRLCRQRCGKRLLAVDGY